MNNSQRDSQTEQIQLKEECRRLVGLGRAEIPQLDKVLGMDDADLREDLRTTIRLATPSQRITLRRMLCDGRVITGKYLQTINEQESGCLIYWLLGFRCNEMIWSTDFEDAATFSAVSRTIRAWDYGKMDRETVRGILDQEIHRQASDPIPAEQETCADHLLATQCTQPIQGAVQQIPAANIPGNCK